MTPDERHMIQDLFQRLAQNGAPVDKDQDAERLIHDLMRRNPDAAYMLAQTTLVYEYQLQQNQNQIADLEAELATIRSQSSARSGGGSFLGGRTGQSRSSVPSAGMTPRTGGSPWGNSGASAQSYDDGGSRIGSNRNAQSGGFAGRGEPQPYQPEPYQPVGGAMPGGRGAPIPPPQAQPAQGGGFFRSALATAAGVAGGVMLANSLGSLFGGGDQAHASQGSSDASANAYQDGQQDAALEQEWAANDAQDAAQDDSFDLGGFDSFET